MDTLRLSNPQVIKFTDLVVHKQKEASPNVVIGTVVSVQQAHRKVA